MLVSDNTEKYKQACFEALDHVIQRSEQRFNQETLAHLLSLEKLITEFLRETLFKGAHVDFD